MPARQETINEVSFFWRPMPARQETINEVSFFWRPMLARPVTNGNVFVFGMKDTAEIECEQANGNLCAEFSTGPV